MENQVRCKQIKINGINKIQEWMKQINERKSK